MLTAAWGVTGVLVGSGGAQDCPGDCHWIMNMGAVWVARTLEELDEGV